MNPSLKSVRSKIIAANHEREYPDGYLCDGCGKCEACSHYDKYERVIRLADILLAIEAAVDKLVSDGITPENFSSASLTAEKLRHEEFLKVIGLYDLARHDLNQQSEQTLHFLDQIL